MDALDPDPRRTPEPLAAILAHLRSRPSRTWSIVITVFGDSVVPRGGSVWLGSLLEIFEGMGIGAGVVRTAMSRLTSDGWLERDRAGRNSFYRLTAKGRENFAPAEERIYGPPPGAWDGRLHLLLPDGEAAAPAGFGALSSGLWIAPPTGAPPADLAGCLRIEGRADLATGRRLAQRAWPIKATGHAYERFAQAFAPLRSWIEEGGELSGLDALVARILLIHEYRRVVLRDPRLPAELLPDPWPGTEARELCCDLYRAVLTAAEAWLDRHGRGEDGPLPPPTADLVRRFGD